MNGQAVVHYHGRLHYLGRHGTPESKTAYARFVAEIQANPNPAVFMSSGEKHVTMRELTAAYLDYAESNINPTDYGHCNVIVQDFLGKLYGDNTPVDDFKPRCLKLVRDEMIQSRRFCWRIVNSYTRRIVAMFAWGVEHDLVLETTWRALKRANRKTKISPSQAARDKARATKSATRYGELYDHRSYRQAIIHAITKGNKVLPEERKIPHWFRIR